MKLHYMSPKISTPAAIWSTGLRILSPCLRVTTLPRYCSITQPPTRLMIQIFSKYVTLDNQGATAVNEFQVATGQQQGADNIYAETTCVCPSYWLAEAFSGKGRSSHKFQDSVPVATHGPDVSEHLGPADVKQRSEFEYGFMSTWSTLCTLTRDVELCLVSCNRDLGKLHHKG